MYRTIQHFLCPDPVIWIPILKNKDSGPWLHNTELYSKSFGSRADVLGSVVNNRKTWRDCRVSKRTGWLSKGTGWLNKITGWIGERTGRLSMRTGWLSKRTGWLSKRTGWLSKRTG